MKLIEKKCPNCGADLSFDRTDKEVTCKYCETSYEIEREKSINDLLGDLDDYVNSENFELHRKMLTKFSKGLIIFPIVMSIFVFVIFLIVFFNVFAHIMG